MAVAVSKDLELRKLPRRVVREVSGYLEKEEYWKALMSLIPKDVSLLEDDGVDHERRVLAAGEDATGELGTRALLCNAKYGAKQMW
jgi:hypothetical protein